MAQNNMDLELINQKNEVYRGAFIFLHGATRNGKWQKEMFLNLLGEKAFFNHVKIIFPTSPVQHYDLQNEEVNVWFNIKKPEKEGDLSVIDLSGIEKSAASVEEIIAQEVRNGIPINRIIVGGISQGAMVAFHVVYRFNPDVAGCIAMSSVIPHEELVYEAIKNRTNNPPLLLTHGEKDEIVPIEWGRKVYENLKVIGLKVEFEEFPGAPHEMTKEEMELVMKKVNQLLPEK